MNTTSLLICPHCLTQNRILTSRLGDKPKCGKCHQTLFTGQAVDLDIPSFEKHLNKSDLPLLVDFWASWCGPCKMMAPQFTEAARLLEPKVRLGKVDTEAEHEIAARYQIRSIPTLKLFKSGKEIATQAGAMQAKDIVNWVRPWIS